MGSTRPNELPVFEERVVLVCLNAIPPFRVLANDVPVSGPDLSGWVLYDDPIAELELRARELGPAFLDFLRVL